MHQAENIHFQTEQYFCVPKTSLFIPYHINLAQFPNSNVIYFHFTVKTIKQFYLRLWSNYLQENTKDQEIICLRKKAPNSDFLQIHVDSAVSKAIYRCLFKNLKISTWLELFFHTSHDLTCVFCTQVSTPSWKYCERSCTEEMNWVSLETRLAGIIFSWWSQRCWGEITLILFLYPREQENILHPLVQPGI